MILKIDDNKNRSIDELVMAGLHLKKFKHIVLKDKLSTLKIT